MCRLIESIRYEGSNFHNLAYHQARVARAFKDQYKLTAPNITEWLHIAKRPAEGVYKCRIVYDAREHNIEYIPYTMPAIRSLKLVWCNNLSYSYKWENRNALMDALQHRGSCDDVLIVRDGFVTDTSYANVVFKQREKWYTPDSFLLAGTMRAYLLDKGLIEQRTIRVADLHRYESCRLINAMMAWNGNEIDIKSIF